MFLEWKKEKLYTAKINTLEFFRTLQQVEREIISIKKEMAEEKMIKLQNKEKWRQ
jgi:hypothetical protein